jgi:Winged helix DNA-binding domain
VADERISWEHALAWRLRRHHLVERVPPERLVEVAADLCGLHAQLTSSAGLSLWARVDGLERGAIDDALWRRRSLVKLWAMRGTLHLLPAHELGTWIAALSTYTGRGMTGLYASTALDEAIGGALDGRPLTREELAAAVEDATGSRELGGYIRESWGSWLKPASWRGRLCFAPSDDGRVRFTTPASWLGRRVDVPDTDDALRDVTRRFLAAYAPTPAEHFGVWGGFGPARGRRLLAALGDEAAGVDVDGERGWALTSDVDELAHSEAPRTVRLLPAFDPWVVGAARDAAAFLEPRYRARVYRPQGWMSPVLLVDGRMTGVWKHARKGRRLVVEVEPFGRVPALARAAVEAEAARLAEFLGGELALSWAT